MKNLLLHFTVITALSLFGRTIPAAAGDLGNTNDAKQVRKVVVAKFGKVLQVSVSHDWALCTASSGENDISVVLHRTTAGWRVVQSDGGAYVGETLRPFGVPPVDIPSLLKVYQ